MKFLVYYKIQNLRNADYTHKCKYYISSSMIECINTFSTINAKRNYQILQITKID